MWLFATNYTDTVRLNNKTVIITGGNTGIGKETAKDLYKRGARILILARDQQKSQNTIKEIQDACNYCETKGKLLEKFLDLGDLSSVRACAKEILKEEKQINILINNAGVMTVSNPRTKDGFETHFGINHLGHFLFTLLLLPRIIKSAPARIINVSSVLHNYLFFSGKARMHFEDINFEHTSYHQSDAYAQSKLANVMFTKELARKLNRLGINNVTTYSLHPGLVATEIGRNFNVHGNIAQWLYDYWAQWFLLTPEQGAQTILYCAINEDLANKSGLYYSNCKEEQPSEYALDEEALEKLWKISAEFVKLDKNYDPFDVKHDNY